MADWQTIVATTLVHFAWLGLAPWLACEALVAMVRPRRASEEYNWRLAAFAATLALPLVIGVVVASRLDHEPLVGAAAASAWAGEPATLADTGAIVPGGGSESAGVAPPAAAPARDWRGALVAGWLLGVAAMSFRLAAASVGVWRLRRAVEPAPPHVVRLAQRLAARLATPLRAGVRQSAAATGAVVVGLWRPLVIVPAAWICESPPAVLEAILAHELAHLRRGDLWINLLQRIGETLLFFQPAVWVLSARLRRLREECCDELAVAVTGDRLQYARALAWAAERRETEWVSGAAAAFRGTRTMAIYQRVRSVLSGRTEAASPGWLTAGACAGVAAATLGAMGWLNAAATDAQAQEEQRDRPAAVQRDGDRREGERREADRPDAERREAERRDQPPRDGERRDVERREPERRDVPRGAEEPRRPDVPANLSPVERELLGMVRELRAEVQRLRAEVNQLRESSAVEQRRRIEVELRSRGEGERPREADIRREPERREGDRPAVERREGDRPRVEADRPVERERRIEAELERLRVNRDRE